MTNPTYDLGYLVGNEWQQFANSTGQDYYYNHRTRVTQFPVPTGFEDTGIDNWTPDNSKTWPQWQNNRTGRIRHDNPNPAPPRTYLDVTSVQASFQTVERTPNSREFLYRRLMVDILRHFFVDPYFTVYQEESAGEQEVDESRPDFSVVKIMSRPGGSFYQYDYCMVESKKHGQNWDGAVDHLTRHCAGNGNVSGTVYAIVHVGLEIQFFKGTDAVLTSLSGRVNLRHDITNVTQWFTHMRDTPFALVL